MISKASDRTSQTAGGRASDAKEGMSVHEARRGLSQVVAVVALVAVGFGLAQMWPAVREGHGWPVPELWNLRPVDLAIQVGLMLAGAFGIRTLLPGQEE